MHFLNRLIYHEPLSICEGASFRTELSTILENDKSEDPTEWLHRNNNYVPRPRGTRTVLSSPLPTSGESGEHNNLMLFFIKKIRHLHICYCTYFKNICRSLFTWAAPQPCRCPNQWRWIRPWTIQTNAWWLGRWWRCHGRRPWIAQRKLIRWWWSHSSTLARYYGDIYTSC